MEADRRRNMALSAWMNEFWEIARLPLKRAAC